MTLLDYLNWKGLTQQEMADSVGVSKSYISLISNGERVPRAKIAQAIVRATKGAVSLEELFAGPVNKRGRAA
jgi:transcriptional regulator with XRE-family HTH domain